MKAGDGRWRQVMAGGTFKRRFTGLKSLFNNKLTSKVLAYKPKHLDEGMSK